MTTVKYLVKYVRYQYNMCYSGCGADNGCYDEENWYGTEEDAQEFCRKFRCVLKCKKDVGRAWEHLGIYDGHGTRLVGLYKVTFEKIEGEEWNYK